MRSTASRDLRTAQINAEISILDGPGACRDRCQLGGGRPRAHSDALGARLWYLPVLYVFGEVLERVRTDDADKPDDAKLIEFCDQRHAVGTLSSIRPT